MARLIAVAQLKGGAGKSTLATNLAGELAREFRTGLIDADMPQGTSSHWAELRGDPELQVITAENVTQLGAAVEQFDSSCDVVVIDLPPRSHKFLREIMAYTDLVLMPLTASPADVWATEQLVDIVREAKKTSKRLKARLVWNRLRPGKSTEVFMATTAASIRTKECESRLGQRNAYLDAMGHGRTVCEGRDAKACEEFRAFVAEVKTQLKLA